MGVILKCWRGELWIVLENVFPDVLIISMSIQNSHCEGDKFKFALLGKVVVWGVSLSSSFPSLYKVSLNAHNKIIYLVSLDSNKNYLLAFLLEDISMMEL